MNDSFFNNFENKAIEIANYVNSKLLIKSRNYNKLVSKKILTNQHQNLSHIGIIGSFLPTNIYKEKRLKSNYQRT